MCHVVWPKFPKLNCPFRSPMCPFSHVKGSSTAVPLALEHKGHHFFLHLRQQNIFKNCKWWYMKHVCSVLNRHCLPHNFTPFTPGLFIANFLLRILLLLIFLFVYFEHNCILNSFCIEGRPNCPEPVWCSDKAPECKPRNWFLVLP